MPTIVRARRRGRVESKGRTQNRRFRFRSRPGGARVSGFVGQAPEPPPGFFLRVGRLRSLVRVPPTCPYWVESGP